MATRKKRITVSLSDHLYETFSRFASLQRRPMSGVIVELLEAVHLPLMRTVALLEAAEDAPKQVRDGLRQTVEEIEGEFQDVVGGNLAQFDLLMGRLEAAAAPRRHRSNPRVVTRGSHFPGTPAQSQKKPRRTRG